MSTREANVACRIVTNLPSAPKNGCIMLYVQRQVRHFNSGSRVVDPDPYVFGPPGSGSVIICTAPDPDSSINKQKKILISTIFFTSLKTYVYIPSKRNKPKIDEKSMIRNWSRIRKSVVRIHNTYYI